MRPRVTGGPWSHCLAGCLLSPWGRCGPGPSVGSCSLRLLNLSHLVYFAGNAGPALALSWSSESVGCCGPVTAQGRPPSLHGHGAAGFQARVGLGMIPTFCGPVTARPQCCRFPGPGRIRNSVCRGALGPSSWLGPWPQDLIIFCPSVAGPATSSRSMQPRPNPSLAWSRPLQYPAPASAAIGSR